MRQEELQKIYLEYWKLYKKFCSINFLYDFTFSLEEFEYCVIIFSEELELKTPDQLTEKYFNYNEFMFHKLANMLNVPYRYEVIRDIYILYLFAFALINGLSSCLYFCEPSSIGWEPLDAEQLKAVRKESKYKFKQKARVIKSGGKFEHYFFEYINGLLLDNLSTYKLLDSIRKKLTSEGDTIKMIQNRDIIYNMIKYCDYISGGFTIDQIKKN